MKNFGRIGREFSVDVNLVIRSFCRLMADDRVCGEMKDMLAEVTGIPQDQGYFKFLDDCEKRYVFGFEGLGENP